MTPDTLRRLLASLPAPAPPHPVDAGVLGEYACVERARGREAAEEAYPRVAGHVRTGCEPCQESLTALAALARRNSQPRGATRRASVASVPADPPAEQPDDVAASPVMDTRPDPLEIAEAVALARAIDAEREALRTPLRPDRSGQIDTWRQSARRRQRLIVDAALVRQRLVARRLFLDRARASLRQPGSRPVNPKAHLMLDDFAGRLDTLARLNHRLGRLMADLRRLGDDPRGPARPQSEALTERGLTLTREALGVDQRIARLQGPLAGMAT